MQFLIMSGMHRIKKISWKIDGVLYERIYFDFWFIWVFDFYFFLVSWFIFIIYYLVRDSRRNKMKDENLFIKDSKIKSFIKQSCQSGHVICLEWGSNLSCIFSWFSFVFFSKSTICPKFHLQTVIFGIRIQRSTIHLNFLILFFHFV